VTKFVALLRGINVGGKHVLPMQELRELLAELGCEDVATYIQSGNVVFNHSGKPGNLSEDISDAIEAQFGFRPFVLLMSATDFIAVASANPYSSMVVEPKFLHVCFLSELAKQPGIERMAELASATEQYVLTDTALYLSAPDGIGRSKLAHEVETCLGVRTTGRNARTVGKICEMIESLG